MPWIKSSPLSFLFFIALRPLVAQPMPPPAIIEARFEKSSVELMLVDAINTGLAEEIGPHQYRLLRDVVFIGGSFLSLGANRALFILRENHNLTIQAETIKISNADLPAFLDPHSKSAPPPKPPEAPPGRDGAQGSPGAHGNFAGKIIFIANHIEGAVTINNDGQDGEDGGPGGDAGSGFRGRPGTVVQEGNKLQGGNRYPSLGIDERSPQPLSDAFGKNGAPALLPGIGGPGGQGGDAGLIQLMAESFDLELNYSVNPGAGGHGARYGGVGRPGDAGPGGVVQLKSGQRLYAEAGSPGPIVSTPEHPRFLEFEKIKGGYYSQDGENGRRGLIGFLVPGGRNIPAGVTLKAIGALKIENKKTVSPKASPQKVPEKKISKDEEIPFIELDPSPETKAKEEAAATPRPQPKKSTTEIEAPKKSISGDVPYGIPVPGKKGYVYSPNVPKESGMIDVRDLPPGTEVHDPYAEGKRFLVP